MFMVQMVKMYGGLSFKLMQIIFWYGKWYKSWDMY